MLSDAEVKEIAQQMDQWHKERLEVEALAARGRSLAPKNFVDPVLTGMRSGEESVRGVFAELSGQGGASSEAK